MNRQLGYTSPADVIEKYPSFYWNSVVSHLEDGVRYLNLTVSGSQWIANLHHHVLCADTASASWDPNPEWSAPGAKPPFFRRFNLEREALATR